MNMRTVQINKSVESPIFVIYKEDKIIGELHLSEVSWDTSICYISYIEIYKKNIGDGSKLIKHIINLLKSHPIIKFIELEATKDSIEFWKKMGFIESNRIGALEIGNTRMCFDLNN
jgi:N-acetylglutamate synthase-like GNAT family acetyltransferase